MKRSITEIVISIVVLLSSVSFGSPNLAGQYWFGSLSVEVGTNAPWAKRGTVSITDNQWDQKWEDYNGKQEFSSTFTTTVQPDGSININFEEETNAGETYNLAWNGDVMIHAGSVLHVGGEGIDIFTRKATNADVSDVLGDHSFFGHYLNWTWPGDSCGWGNLTIDPNGTVIGTWTNDHGVIESDTFNWILDEVNSTVDASGPTINPHGHAALFLGEGGIGITSHIKPEEGRDGDDVGYNIFIKKTDQVITMADIAGTYLVRFLETGPGGVPYTCGQGTCVIEAVDDVNGISLMDAYFSDGEHNVSSENLSIGPGNALHFDDESVPDGIVNVDKNLIFGPEYRYKHPPTREDYDWLGGIFLIRIPNNITDPNGNGDVDCTWVVEPPMNVARDQFAGGIINGKIYVFGGNGNPDGVNLKSAEMYDPTIEQWTMLADNNHNYYGNGGVEELTSAVVNGKLYVFGAYGGIDPDGYYGVFNFNEMYDPETDTWTTIAQKPTMARAGPTTVYNNEIYIFGGWPKQNGFLATVESYNPASNTWRYVTDIPLRMSDFAIATIGTEAYLFGGFDGNEPPNGQLLDNVITYDFETDVWTTTGFQPLPVKKRFMYSNSAPVIDGKVYLIGVMREDISGQYVYCNRVDIYSPAANTWEEGTPLPLPLDGHVTLSIGEKIYLIGGFSDYGIENRSKPEVISFETNSCSQ